MSCSEFLPFEEEARKNNPQNVDLYLATEQWVKKYPEVYEMFRRFTQEAMARGRSFGIGLIAERVRWECFFLYDEEYKINNNYRAYIARRLLREFPKLSDFIKFRETNYGPKGQRSKDPLGRNDGTDE